MDDHTWQYHLTICKSPVISKTVVIKSLEQFSMMLFILFLFLLCLFFLHLVNDLTVVENFHLPLPPLEGFI